MSRTTNKTSRGTKNSVDWCSCLITGKCESVRILFEITFCNRRKCRNLVMDRKAGKKRIWSFSIIGIYVVYLFNKKKKIIKVVPILYILISLSNSKWCIDITIGPIIYDFILTQWYLNLIINKTLYL